MILIGDRLIDENNIAKTLFGGRSALIVWKDGHEEWVCDKAASDLRAWAEQFRVVESWPEPEQVAEEPRQIAGKPRLVMHLYTVPSSDGKRAYTVTRVFTSHGPAVVYAWSCGCMDWQVKSVVVGLPDGRQHYCKHIKAVISDRLFADYKYRGFIEIE